jgi:hypothetical protein
VTIGRAISLAGCIACYKRTKHIDYRYHHVTDMVKGKVKVKYIPTYKMLADICTKSSHGPKHGSYARGLGVTGSQD